MQATQSTHRREFSQRTFFLRRCARCRSWFHFAKSWTVYYAPVTGKKTGRSFPRYDCHTCGSQDQVSSW